ncbi:GGDEF domain-containing protein [Kineococcus rubinsiae]|uniref:GGDEF domain-containing protein n=1 Tax=Kineococcus rubinsiae TaxID=2609562 RepID=UPI001430371E|nr:GGDEF domain-containing protein [Kineococcus rubinsiae]NIZ93325.1 GGDEF domain-containing protein [Kineococcus rubinsiae]
MPPVRRAREQHRLAPRPPASRGRRLPAVPRRRLVVLAPAVLIGACLWVLSGYSAVVDAKIVALEVVAGVVAIGSAVVAPSTAARRALLLLSAWVALTAVGDAYWLLTVDPTGLSYVLGEFEPGFTITVEIVRYAALLTLLAHAVPRRRSGPGDRRAPGRGAVRLGGRTALGHVQATATTAALVLLATPAGALVQEGKSYSVFCFFDVVTIATAVVVVLRSLSSVPRPEVGPSRRLLATAAGVAGLVGGDAVMVLSQTRAWVLGGGLGLVLAVGGAAVLLVTYLGPASPGAAGTASPLPAVPARPRPHVAVAVSVLVQNVLPTVIAVLVTVQLVSASLGGDRVGPATVGTAAAALVLSLLRAVAGAQRAHRDEEAAVDAERDELTGAYTRRGFSALAEQCLREGAAQDGASPRPWKPAPPQRVHRERGTDPGWCVALLDLDGFKGINDTHGHGAGDQVLGIVARRAAGVVDGHGVVARFGGDEFVVLVRTGPPTAPATQRLVRRLEEAIAAPAALDGGVVVQVGVSIGLAGIPEDGRGDGLAVALEAADRRMYRRKQGSRG